MQELGKETQASTTQLVAPSVDLKDPVPEQEFAEAMEVLYPRNLGSTYGAWHVISY